MTLINLHALIDAADGEPHRFPPALIYNEGWLLRPILWMAPRPIVQQWREGELQIKGRVSSLGVQVFCGRHQGEVEHGLTALDLTAAQSQSYPAFLGAVLAA